MGAITRRFRDRPLLWYSLLGGVVVLLGIMTILAPQWWLVLGGLGFLGWRVYKAPRGQQEVWGEGRGTEGAEQGVKGGRMEQPLASFTSIQIWPKIHLNLYESEVEVDSRALPAGRITKRLRYEQIANVAITKNWMYTTLTIESTGGHTLGVERMDYEAAKEASDAIRQRMALVASSSGSPASYSGSPSPAASDIFAQIKSLADLREANIITQAEFEAKKKDLLDRL
jgi:hypothetical protein